MLAKQTLAGPNYLLSKKMVVSVVLTITYLGTMLILFLFASTKVFEPTLLLPILNTIFAGALPIVVSIIAMRSYFLGGLKSILFMGCGLMTFGSGAILAGWLIGGSQGPNVNVTIYNVGALLSAVLHALGVVFVLIKETPDTSQERKRSNLIWTCSGIFLFLFYITLATLQGATPLFFVQGTGPTLLRQLVLGSSAILFFLSALFLIKIFKREQKPFYYWYALSLIMISLGLVAAFIQPSVGSPMGWLNRVGHYIAGIYAMAAILTTSSYARKIGVPFKVEMTELFRQAQMSYEVLVETVTEPIVTTDQYFRIIQWNSAAVRKFGYSQNEAFGLSLLDLVIAPSSSEIFKNSANEIVKVSIDRSFVGSPIEITGKRKDSDNLPLEVSLSGVRVKGRLLFVFVFRDSTKRKTAEETQRKQADGLLKASEARYHSVVSALSEGVVLHARDGTITAWNRAAERILGLSGEQMQGRTTLDPRWRTIHEDGTPFLGETRPSQEVLRTGVPQLNVTMGIYKPDGALSWTLINAVPIFESGNPSPTAVVVSFTDITERRHAEQKLHIAAIAFEAQEGILITDANDLIIQVNRAFTNITGYTAEEVVGKSLNILISDRHDANFDAAMWENIHNTGGWNGEIWSRHKDGEICSERFIINAVKDSNDIITNYVATLSDITMSNEAADEIRNLAFYDPLTRLPNRRLLLDRLKYSLASSVRSGLSGTLLFIDLDNFKALNDTLGHDIGDSLLQQTAQRLISCVREVDTVARIGGTSSW